MTVFLRYCVCLILRLNTTKLFDSFVLKLELRVHSHMSQQAGDKNDGVFVRVARDI